MSRLLLIPLALLAGCCASPRFGVEAFDPRLEPERRATFALICPVLDDPRAWAYADPPAALRALEETYRPDPTRRPPGFVDPFPDPRGLRPPADAPDDVQVLLKTARRELTALGYRPARGGAADLVVCLSTTRRAGRRLDRVALHVGAVAEGRFEPFLLSVAATVPEDDPCPVALDALVTELTRVLPPRGAAP